MKYAFKTFHGEIEVGEQTCFYSADVRLVLKAHQPALDEVQGLVYSVRSYDENGHLVDAFNESTVTEQHRNFWEPRINVDIRKLVMKASIPFNWQDEEDLN